MDETTKAGVDRLFSGLGLDTPTAVRMFFSASLAHGGLPFLVRNQSPNAELLEAIEDARLGRDLRGPYKTAGEAVAAMLRE